LIVIACVAALAAASGCGGGNSSAQDTAQAYVDARNDKDAAKICDLLSDQLKQALQTAGCEKFWTEATAGANSTFKLGAVQENGDQATAVVEATTTDGGQTQTKSLKVLLAKQDGDWKISGVGT
jgi:ketosteroid isomerase-like protein